MKKLLPVVLVLAVVTLACGLTPKAEPTPVPPMPTVAPLPTSVPTLAPLPTIPLSVPTDPPTVPVPQVPSAPAGVIFTDDFSAESDNWTADSTAEVSRSFTNGAFQVHVIATMMDTWTSMRQQLSGPVAVDLDITKVSGPETAQYGATCGYVDNDNLYGAGVGNDGYAEIFTYAAGERQTLADVSGVTGINTGNATNHVRLVCSGTNIAFYVNNSLVLEATAPAEVNGKIGLLAGTFDEADAVIQFDNLVVTQLDAQGMAPMITGTVLFNDDFSDTSSGWDRVDDSADYFTDYHDGKYRIVVNQANWDYWANPNDLVVNDNVIVDVDVQYVAGGQDATMGVICGYDMSTHRDFHVLSLSPDGTAMIYKYKEGEPINIYTGAASNVQPGTNHLTAKCIGQDLTLLVNGVEAATVSDPDLKIGNVGLIGGAYDTVGTEVFFDNFTVQIAP